MAPDYKGGTKQKEEKTNATHKIKNDNARWKSKWRRLFTSRDCLGLSWSFKPEKQSKKEQEKTCQTSNNSSYNGTILGWSPIVSQERREVCSLIVSKEGSVWVSQKTPSIHWTTTWIRKAPLQVYICNLQTFLTTALAYRFHTLGYTINRWWWCIIINIIIITCSSYFPLACCKKAIDFGCCFLEIRYQSFNCCTKSCSPWC